MKEPSTSKNKVPGSLSEKKQKIAILPRKKILVDVGIGVLVNMTIIYIALFFTSDTSAAMIGVVWVGIIAWRGGVSAGLIGCVAILLSNVVAMNIPPHADIPMVYYFDNKVPGFMIGLMQCFITGLIVGYISRLFHRLHDEIRLREKVQKDLENNVAELDAFGHTVAHDLKNPLMVINMSIESLVNEFESSKDVVTKKKMAFINDGTKTMIKIIEAILLLAGIKKIDRKAFRAFPVSESVEEALKRMEFDLRSHDARIVKPDHWPSAVGYAPWITEVWVNYISNAVKYGGNRGIEKTPVIELGYDRPDSTNGADRECIRFWVKDNGDGIAKDKIGSLFKEFTRLQVKGNEGHGLGLSIVKSIIDKCSGTVGVESEAGNGCLFYFTLPSATAETTDT